MLEVRDIHTYYGDSYVLQGISLSVEVGKVSVLLGRNGVGKTTAIRSIVGFTPPRRGRILVRGDDITDYPAHRIAKAGVSLVPQGRRLFQSLTVLEHLTVFERGGADSRWKLDDVFELFPRLKDRRQLRGALLSGGEQQMLSIARALLTNPALLVMDEPSEGLSPLLVEQVADVIRSLKMEGDLSILLVEQNLGLALDLADYVYVMNKGVIVFEGTPEELRAAGDVQRAYLGV